MTPSIFWYLFLVLTANAQSVPLAVPVETSAASVTTNSQEPRDEDDFFFNYDHNNFNMKMRLRVQGRATYSDVDAENSTNPDRTAFEVRRTRLTFEGAALDPRLFYKVQLAFSRGDMDWDTNAYPNVLRDAIIGWKLTDKNTVFFGQAKLPGNRQTMISSSKLELVDRSLLNSSFTIERDMGLQSWNKFGDSRPLWLKLAISNGEGRGTDNGDTGLASTARVEWLPLGSFARDGDFFEGDLEFEPTPKLSLATAYSVNKRTHRVSGQMGKTILNGASRDMSIFFSDVLFKYRGWSFFSEYANRRADDPLINPTQYILVGEGVSAQLSYVFSNNYSPAVRWTKIWPEEQIYSRADIRTQYTVGLSKYFRKHKIKVQSDLTYEDIDKPMIQEQQDNYTLRVQFEVGI